MRRILLVWLAVGLMVVWVCPNHALAAGRRVALVIGNGDYKEAPLDNPVNDAKDMAEALQKVGFVVTLKTNADKRTMIEAIDIFGEQIGGAEAALFFFSGHGMQIKGRNYLLPTGCQISNEWDAESECVDTYRVFGQVAGSGSRVNIVILDACRTNPFTRKFREPSRGLAKIDAATGTLIAYATAPDNVASDGTGRNSPYTAALKKYIQSSRLPVELMFKRVREEVLSTTGNKQTPWEHSSLVGDFYFVATGPAPSSPAPAAPSPPPITPPSPGAVSSYEDVIKQREQAERQWAAWQERMDAEFAKAQRYDGESRLTPKEKTNLWQEFLNGFGQDNPHSTNDESLRQQANTRLDYRRRESESMPASSPPSAASPSASSAALATNVPGVTDTEIVIGISNPLSGPAAILGLTGLGAKAYADYINP